ncbi:hypothetical protein BU16DRAFT_557110 [Lophium mytilinum]|uniref:F-box domain-containing protein n=1 Tax=Lophium mytilinum TaxID=390894 RepID=A0A6A6RA79_9PEZI|nr:hypothetical protein BU16DRAFT_557110 [Lophium mytilinum]
MSGKVCRLRLRAGEPVGLSIYPAETLMSLPCEVREMIYELLLVDSVPITVYSHRLTSPYTPNNDQRAPLHSASSRFAHLTLGLLRVNRTIAMESASLFYSHNTFKFGDRHQSTLYHADGPPEQNDYWDAIYSFLYCIGPEYRARIRYIEADISRPIPVTKDTDGTVSSLVDDSWMRKVHSRDQHAYIHGPVHDMISRYGEMTFDHVSPAIVAVFRSLGHYGLKLQLALMMEYNVWPHLYHEEYISGWSNEVPDHVEAMRKRFTRLPNGEGERVEVLWKGRAHKSWFMGSSATLVKDGWELVDVQEDSISSKEFTRQFNLEESVGFTLKRTGASSQ